MSGPKHVTDKEWSTFAPAFMKMAFAGPGVAPAQHMAEHAEKMLSFSKATTVVDMGCGPGQITDAVLKLHNSQLPPSASVIGADNSADMLQQYEGRKKTEIEQGNTYWQRAETKQVDIHDCAAFADDSVSHMLCGFVVFLVPEPAKAVSALKRVVAPGGVIAISSLQTSEWLKFMFYPYKVRPDLAGPSPPPNSWSAPDGVRKNLEEAGLKDIEVVTTEAYMPFDDHDTICRYILTKLPVSARAVAQMTEEEVLKTHEMMVTDLKAMYPTTPAKMVGKCTIAYCRK
jgi:SAM-dependent methyltransferase